MAAWADLPSDLLISISDRLDILSCIRFSAVCTTWASTIRPRLPTFPSFCLDQPIPWVLLFVGTSKYNPDYTDFTFYDITTATSYCIPSPIPFSSLDCPRWIGSNSGWLVCIDLNFKLYLISPLTGTHLLLPSVKLPHGYQGNLISYFDSDQYGFEWYSHEKVIICQGPDHDSGSDTGLLLLCLFFPHGLAVLKVGGDKWTWLDHERFYYDAIVYRGKIYATTNHTLHCWELKGSSFKVGKVISIRENTLDRLEKYLVESGDKLLMVCKKKWRGQGKEMSVYELDLDQRDQLWSDPVMSIGDNVVFMGLGNSRIASIVGLDGVQGNCIYYVNDYIDDRLHTGHVSGVYNIKMRTYERFPLFYRPPTWFWPCNVK